MNAHPLFHPSTQRKLVRNIRAVLRQATAEEVSAGVGWYPVATRGCVVWAKQYGIAPETVASVIAALSPQVSWQSNLRWALNLIANDALAVIGASRPLQANIRKANAILSDGALLPDNYFKSAYKVCAFARNLQGDTETVTVDTHAAQLAMNDPCYVFRFRPKPYMAMAQAYRRAAHLEGLEPSELQAITWLTWKRLYPTTHKRALIAQRKRR